MLFMPVLLLSESAQILVSGMGHIVSYSLLRFVNFFLLGHIFNLESLFYFFNDIIGDPLHPATQDQFLVALQNQHSFSLWHMLTFFVLGIV